MLFFGVDLRILVHLRNLWNSVYFLTEFVHAFQVKKNSCFTPGDNSVKNKPKLTSNRHITKRMWFRGDFFGRWMIYNGKMKFETTS